jgi:uncharacterized protein
LIIDLEKVTEDEPLRWREIQQFPAADLDRPELLELGEVAASGEIRRISSGHVLKASISYRQTVACTRCLKPIVIPVEEEATLLLEVGKRPTTADELQLQMEDLDTVNLKDTTLDTRPILAEQVLLNVPMRALCREDCPGLCPVCGTDLADGDCGCDKETADPRWAALSSLRSALDD